MRYRFVVVLLAACCTCVLHSSFSSAQQQDDAAEGNRKVINRVLPAYPPVARTMGIRGNVKVDVVVGPNGTVKSLQVKGGHPVLAQAAADAVRKWKWVPAAHDTKEPVVVIFDPKQ